MGYFMVHLKVAEKLLKNNANIKDIGAFYKGSLAPDAIMFRKGCKRSEKSSTHFCVGDEGWGYYTNYDEWENNLNLNIRNYANTTNPDFLFGYYAHIITDIAYTSRFWTPIRVKEDKKYIDDYLKNKNSNIIAENKKNIDSYLKDIAEIDSLLLESLENKEILWSLLENSTNYCLSGLFDVNDLSILINEMINHMYNNRKSDLDYEFNVVKFSDMLDFIDRVVSKISNSQFIV